jgi:hypothetical protein
MALDAETIDYADYKALDKRFGGRATPQPSFYDPSGNLLM